MSIDLQLRDALGAQSVRIFIAVRMELGENIINIIDGSATITFPVGGDSTTFDGYDGIFGSLSSVSMINESIATEAPTVQVVMLPPSSSAIGEMSFVGYQDSPVYIWVGAVNPATGAVIGVPERVWSGRVDVVKTTTAAGTRIVEIDTVSAFERMFVASEACRLNDGWHQSVWPGEDGLKNTSLVEIAKYWGGDAPRQNGRSSPPAPGSGPNPGSGTGSNNGRGGGGGTNQNDFH